MGIQLGTRTFAPIRGRKLDVANPAQGVAETKVDMPEDWVFHQEWRYRSADGTNNVRWYTGQLVDHY